MTERSDHLKAKAEAIKRILREPISGIPEEMDHEETNEIIEILRSVQEEAISQFKQCGECGLWLTPHKRFDGKYRYTHGDYACIVEYLNDYPNSKSKLQQARKEGFAEAIEKASNLLVDDSKYGRMYCWLLRCEFANQIRALKPSASKDFK